MSATTEVPRYDSRAGLLLLFAVFVLALCGLVYELIAGTLSSYLLGDSVTHFSLVIGIFLFSMGIGSFLSRFLRQQLLAWFVGIEILIGLVGGTTALVSFASFAFTDLYLPTLFIMLTTVGMLVGLEIPLVLRILRCAESLRLTAANVLSVDYLGCLAASIAFPFFLVPHLGLVRAGAVMGLANVAVAAMLCWTFASDLGRWRRRLVVMTGLTGALLLAVTLLAGQAVSYLENRLYQDEVIFARNTPLQRVVVTRWRNDIRLYLNGLLQFSSLDEYRYHEALVHPPTSLVARPEQILILGGGDGLAAREVLKYPEVRKIDLVDIDVHVTELFRDNSLLARLNDYALRDPRITIHNMDALKFLENNNRQYDVIIVDLPDPSDDSLAKLYSLPFYRLIRRSLAPAGMMVCQATSPFRSRETFWCIHHTVQAAGGNRERGGPAWQARAYQSLVPTFGLWGFVLAGHAPVDPAQIRLRVTTKYLTDELIAGLFVFSSDTSEVETSISGLMDPAVSRLYRSNYRQLFD
ncbi:MAG: polyamine aminopropyltransferase [Planctomycetota bacterium]|nr:polyamine aminopropyltransferase [Planctomycetota bacterium]